MCGARLPVRGYDENTKIGATTSKKQLCYDCAYWSRMMKHPPKNLEVMDGYCLTLEGIYDKSDKTLLLGGKGKIRYFMRKDHTLVCSNDIWHIGRVPERFLEHFPDTITEISKNTYMKLKRFDKPCQSKSCLDRYRCLRYRVEEEKDPYNSIPKNWKAGGERCLYFIDREKIAPENSLKQKIDEQ